MPERITARERAVVIGIAAAVALAIAALEVAVPTIDIIAAEVVPLLLIGRAIGFRLTIALAVLSAPLLVLLDASVHHETSNVNFALDVGLLIATFVAAAAIVERGQRGLVLALGSLAEELRDESTRLRERDHEAIAESLAQPAWATDGSGTGNYFNAAWRAYTGLTRAQLARGGIEAAVHSEDGERLRSAWTNSNAGAGPGGVIEVKLRLRDRLGAFVPFIARATPIFAADGATIVRWFGVCIEVPATKPLLAESFFRPAYAQPVSAEPPAPPPAAAVSPAAPAAVTVSLPSPTAPASGPAPQPSAPQYAPPVLAWSAPAVPGLRFVFGENADGEPGGAAAGRFTDAVRLFDGRVLVAAGEVSRSGSSGPAAADALRRTIRGAAEVLADPLAILAAADRAVRDDPSQPGGAACVGIYDPIALTFAVASAGAVACSLRGPERVARTLGAPAPALGMRRPGDAEPVEIALVPGSRLTLAAGATELLHIDVGSEDPADPRAPLRRSFETFDAGAVLRARAEVVATILAAGATQAEAGDAETVFGELVGNVVRHAPGICEIALDRAGPMPVLSVLDRGRGRGFTHTAMLRADAFAESGRGLFIARALALEFNAFPRVGGGTHVRAVLSASGRPAGGTVTAA